MASTACTTACSPDPQTRLIVSPGTSTGSPALRPACLATFMPMPACSTHPMTTSPMSAGLTFARAIASRITTAPRSTADTSLRAPPNEPIGVRQALRITASNELVKRAYPFRHLEIGAGGGLHLLDGGVGGDLAQHE